MLAMLRVLKSGILLAAVATWLVWRSSNPESADGFGILALLAAIYFLPTIVASWRNHLNGGAIAVLNILLGWTVLGWIAALVWASTNQRRIAA